MKQDKLRPTWAIDGSLKVSRQESFGNDPVTYGFDQHTQSFFFDRGLDHWKNSNLLLESEMKTKPGDSGAPLLKKVGNKWLVIGIFTGQLNLPELKFKSQPNAKQFGKYIPSWEIAKWLLPSHPTLFSTKSCKEVLARAVKTAKTPP
jgi:hypothetical protein